MLALSRSLALCALAAALVLALGACGGDDDPGSGGTGGDAPPSGSASELLQDSWMYYVAQDPSRLAPFESEGSGGAWLNLYHNNLRPAVRDFDKVCTPSSASLADRAAGGYPCVGLARGHIELAELFGTAAEVDRVAIRQLRRFRDSHSDEVLPSVHEPYFAGVNLLLSGEVEAGTERLKSYLAQETTDPLLADLAGRITEGLVNGDPLVGRVWGSASEPARGHSGFKDLASSEATAAYRARLDFISAVARGELDEAEPLLRPVDLRQADLSEELVQRGGDAPAINPVISHHDTAFLIALSRYHAARADEAVADAAELGVLKAQADRLLGRSPSFPDSAPSVADGLALVVFSEVPTPGDLLAAERAWPTPVATLRRLGGAWEALAIVPTTELGDLDPFTDGSNGVTIALGELLSSASAEGGNLDAGMGLSERLRGHLLRERAVQYQQSFDVRLETELGSDVASAGVAARSLLELALDKNPAPPNAELKKARISFRNDPPALAALARAELDTRRPGEANDYIRPLSEVYPELIAVRNALTLLDTAWNPPKKGAAPK